MNLKVIDVLKYKIKNVSKNAVNEIRQDNGIEVRRMRDDF